MISSKSILVAVVILLSSLITDCQTNHKECPVLKGPYFGQNPPGIIPEIFAP